MKLTGMIAFWSGSVGSIPLGWILCDGTNGTPDLRNRFTSGAGRGFYSHVGDSGGGAFHSHDFTGDGHHHETFGPEPGGMAAGTDFHFPWLFNVATGTTDPKSNLPPYHALLPIMVT